MSKQSKKQLPNITFGITIRPVIAVPARTIDTTVETAQGQETTMKQLVDDFVMGRLDPRQLGGGSYDPEGSEELDPLNTPGLTFEEATQIADAGKRAAAEIKQQRKTVANASADEQQKEQGEGANSGD